MPSPMKIIVCFDGTNAAGAALELGGREAAAHGAAVHIVHVIEQRPDLVHDEIRRIENRLFDAKTTLMERHGLACETLALVTNHTAGEAIAQYAREQAANMLVIGVRRRSKVGKLVFGSTAQYVILKAPCPVLTVK